MFITTTLRLAVRKSRRTKPGKSEAVRLARLGTMVAVPWVPYELVERIERKVPAKPDVTAAELVVIKASGTTRIKAEALNCAATAERFCDECGYPWPSWWKSCRVCDAMADDHADKCKDIVKMRRAAKRKQDDWVIRTYGVGQG